MKFYCPRLVIAGTRSGVGKTSITLALALAFKKMGLKVQTFKVGPDFLDPSYLACASERICYNLDSWMSGDDYIYDLFLEKAKDVDISIIEGVMGLFDGVSSSSSFASTAEIARRLDAPVLLVIDGHGLSRSLAATVKGFSTFEPDVKVAGVLVNNCGSESHVSLIKNSLDFCSLPPLAGAIPRGGFPGLPSRHLGLVTANTDNFSLNIQENLLNVLKSNVSLEKIYKLAKDVSPLQEREQSHFSNGKMMIDKDDHNNNRIARIGVAYDEAFHFYYQDLFDKMKEEGSELIFFSPVNDKALPNDLDGIYFGGGYPELKGEELSENKSMLQSIKHFAFSNRPIYAECGGLVYLSSGIQNLDGEIHEFAGLLPGHIRMRKNLKALGYVETTLQNDSLWGKKGDVFRGHEFHYSEWVSGPPKDQSWQLVYFVRRQRSGDIFLEGSQKNNILASYIHMHYPSRPGAVKYFISTCRKSRQLRRP